jgi:hypothetical protein
LSIGGDVRRAIVACGSREFFDLLLTVHPHDLSIMNVGIFRQVNERASIGNCKVSRSAVRRGFHPVENRHRLARDLQSMWVERHCKHASVAFEQEMPTRRVARVSADDGQDLLLTRV